MHKIRTGLQVIGTVTATSLFFVWPFLFGFMTWDEPGELGGLAEAEDPVVMMRVDLGRLMAEAAEEASAEDVQEPRVETESEPEPALAKEAMASSSSPPSSRGGPRSRPSDAEAGRVASKSSSAGGGRKRKKCSDDNPQIQKMSRDAWEVERRLVDWYALRWKELGSLGYAVPHESRDGVRGMRIGGIRCNNDLNQAGLRNGDVVVEVNGRPVRNLGQAVWLYQTVNKRKEIVVTVIRRGERRDLHYDLT